MDIDEGYCQYYMKRGRSCRNHASPGDCICGTHRRKMRRVRHGHDNIGISKMLDEIADFGLNGDQRKELISQLFFRVSASDRLLSNVKFAKTLLVKAHEFYEDGFTNPYRILDHRRSNYLGCMHTSMLQSIRCVYCTRWINRLESLVREQLPAELAEMVVKYSFCRTIGNC